VKFTQSILGGITAYWERVQQFTPNARWIITSRAIQRIGFGVRQAIFNLFLLSLGYSKTFLGGFLSLGLFMIALGALIAGPYTQRIGERNALILAHLITFLSAFVQIIYPTPEVLLMMTVIFNLGNGLSTTSYSPLMTRSSSYYERTHLFGSSQGLSIGTSFAGSVVGGYLPGLFAISLMLPIDSAPTFQLALFAWFIPLLIAAIPLLFIKSIIPDSLEEFVDDQSQSLLEENQEVEPKARRIVFLKFALTGGLIGLGAGFIIPFMNVWFWDFYNLPTHIVGIITGLGQGTMAAGVLLSPILSTRIGKVKTTFVTQSLSLPFIIIMATIVNPYVAIASYLFRNVLMNSSNPVNASLRMELVPSRWRPLMSSIHMAAQGFGRATSVQISGQLFDQELFLLPFWFTLSCYTTSTVLYGLFFWRAEDRQKEVQGETHEHKNDNSN
jgi:MFS family permease